MWGVGALGWFAGLGYRKTRLRAPTVARGSPPIPNDAGYAAADALVALMILALTIVTSLGAVAQGRRLTQAAVETRQARSLSRYLFAVTPMNREPGEVRGRSADFAWAVTVDEPVRAYGAATLCQRRVRMEAVASGRIYAASTAEICPNDDYEE